jgi:large repetitive protein
VRSIAYLLSILVTLVCFASAQSTARSPRVDFSTYLSGNGSTLISAVTVDSSGYIYVAGRTWAADFPTTAGAYDRTPSQGCNQDGCFPYSGFAAKLSRDGRDLIYSTLLKGNAPSGIAVDSQGYLYISGDIVATEFVGTSGTLFTKCNEPIQQQFCNWITKLNPTGTDVIFSTLVNGAVHCMFDENLALNSKGEIYIAGAAFTSQVCPTTASAFRRTVPTNTTAVQVMKISADGSKILYSTFVSGSNPNDSFGGLAVDRNDHAIVAGKTFGGTFPTSASAYQRTAKNGASSAFISKLSADGSTLLASTLIGGSQYSEADDLAVDNDLNVYVTGVTYALDFPTTAKAYRRTHDTADCQGTCSDLFVTKLPPNFGSLTYSTFFGLTGEDDPARLAVDTVGHAYLTGNTGNGFPLVSPIQSAVGPLYLTKFSTGGDKLLFSSYLGGTNQNDFSYANLAVDIAGNAYLGGYSRSQTFATTPNAYQTTNHSPTEAGIAMKVNLPPCTLSSTSPSVTICTPTPNTIVSSPLLLAAGATDDHSINAMAVYVDGVKRFTINNHSHFDTKLTMAVGNHNITFKAWDSAGRVISRSESIKVQ